MITSRPYRDEADLQRLIRFLTEQRALHPVQRWHVGDLVWRMFYSSLFDPSRYVRLWENGGGVVGFGWFYPPNGADLHLGDPALLPDMIAWAESCVSEGSLYLATLDANSDETGYLEAHGFQRNEPFGFHLRRQLDGDVPGWTLPPGFTLRPVAGAAEVEARAQLHRTAFESQAVTDDGYSNVIRAPGYQPDLDLLVVAPDGRLAAFCLGWLDEVNRVGLFEPIGTHPDFRRMGLAQALILEGLRRMQERSMESVLVATGAENVASRALYESLGFAPESRERVYSR